MRDIYMEVTSHMHAVLSEEVNNIVSTLNNVCNVLIDEYTLPLLEYCLHILNTLYMQLRIPPALLNTIIFIIKYVPTGLYLCKFIKDIYVTSRKRIKEKQLELEDIQLQIQIVNTKLCVRDAEFAERSRLLRLAAEKLRKLQATVRELITTDKVLAKTLENAAEWDANIVYPDADLQQEEHALLIELLRELKYDQLSKVEKPAEKLDISERLHKDHSDSTLENSAYSSISDVDIQQDCRVKIVKVTNVYKIACLKHYIKQKRLRRATKKAMLKKKMDDIKELLEDWQRTLNMVINSKLTILNIDSHPMDVLSQEAMGDYSKPRGSSDTDSDIKNSWSDSCYDEYSLNWTQNPYKPYTYNYEDGPDAVPREPYDTQDYGDGQYTSTPIYCEGVKVPNPNMLSIIEETNSQIAFEEIKSETDDDYACRDLVAI